MKKSHLQIAIKMNYLINFCHIAAAFFSPASYVREGEKLKALFDVERKNFSSQEFTRGIFDERGSLSY